MSDWVAPDTPSAPAAPAQALPPRPAQADTAVPVRVPVPLQPLTVPDVLDGSLRAWKLAPATIVALAAVFVVPAQALLGAVTRDAVDDVDVGQSFGDAFTATGPDDVDAGFLGNAFLLGSVLEGLALAFVTAGVAILVSGWYVGRRAAVGELVAAALRRTWPLAAAWVLVHLVEAVFVVLLVIPVVVPMTWFAVVSPVVACEPVGPVAAMRRSARLTRRRFGAVLLTCVLVAVVDALLSSALTALGALYLESDLPAGWVVSTAVTAGALLVTVPFVAGAATLLYLDLRVRTEGLDIELAAARRFA